MLDGITHGAEASRGLLCWQSDACESGDTTHISEPAALVVRAAARRAQSRRGRHVGSRPKDSQEEIEDREAAVTAKIPATRNPITALSIHKTWIMRSSASIRARRWPN